MKPAAVGGLLKDMRGKGVSGPPDFAYEPDSTVRARSPALDERMMTIAAKVAPDVKRLLAAYEARVATCDHLAFDEITGRIAYRCGDDTLFSGGVEEMARLGEDGVLTFAWRQHPSALPPTPRVDTARNMLTSLGLHALLLGEIATLRTRTADVDAILMFALHLYEADGLFREERGGATIFYAVFEGALPQRPGRSGKLGETLQSFRLPRITTRPIPREESEGDVPREESVIAVTVLTPVPPGVDRALLAAPARMPELSRVLPVAQIVFKDLATVLERVRAAVLLVNVVGDRSRAVTVDVMATDGDGELHAFEPSSHLREAVNDLLLLEDHAGNGALRRLVVHMNADASIRIQFG